MVTRRQWLKSATALGVSVPVSLSLVDQLMAAPVSQAEKFFGIDRPGDIIRLGSNENPYGPSAKARKAIEERINYANRYAYTEGNELKVMIAEREGVTPDHIMLGCGSSELLCLTGMGVGLEGGAILSAYPVFRLLMDYAKKFNARWDTVNLDENLTHNLGEIAAAVKSDTRLIFVINPNNPTGTVVKPDTLKDFCVTMAKKAPVFVDEAYIEFLEPSQQVSMTALVKQGHNVIVSRTFSKIYGLAGARIGYMIAQPDMIRKISRNQIWGTQNQLAIAAAKASYGDEEFMTFTRKRNAEARAHLNSYLDSKKWFYGKSSANVVFFPAPRSGQEILKETEAKGFQIRVWDYDNREWCRVSIGTLEEMKAFTKAFDEIIS